MTWHCPSYVLRSISGGRTILFPASYAGEPP